MLASTALAYFAEVARQGSFQAGAEQLHVAVSAVSRQISLLERELDTTLFERSRGRRPLRLTAAGEALMRHVQDMESSTARLTFEMQALRGLSKGHIRFGASEVFIRQMFPDVLGDFCKQYPQMTYTVEIGSMQRVLNLLSVGELDIGLVFNPVTTPGVETVFEVDLPNHVLVDVDHPLAGRESLTLADCAPYGMALPSRDLSSKVIYDEMFFKAKIRPHVVLVSNSYEMLVTAASIGLAITLVNAALVSPSVLLGDHAHYRCIPVDDPLVRPVRLALCAPEGRAIVPPTQGLVDLLKAAMLKIGAPAGR